MALCIPVLSLLLLCSFFRRALSDRVEVLLPDVVEVREGGTASITCSFSIPGHSHYSYLHWLYEKNGRTNIYYMGQDRQFAYDTEYKDRIRMADNFTLLISEVTLQDERTFLCQIGAGPAGFGENRTELRVYKSPEPPDITVNDVGILVTDDETPEIAKCKSRNGYPTPNITWYKNRNSLHQGRDGVNIATTVIKESSGLYTVSSTLHSRLSKEDRNASFYCEVNYRLPGMDRMMESERVNVTILYPMESVTLVVESPSRLVMEGDRVVLRCKGDGNPPPAYTFLRVQEDPVDGAEMEEEIEASDGLLILESVRRNESVHYRCRALDFNSGVSLQADTMLSVNYLDAIQMWPESPVELSLGDNATIHCSAMGSRTLAFHWQWKGEVIALGPLLNLSSVDFKSSGHYSCVATVPGVPGLNASKGVTIVVKGPPLVSVKHHSLWVLVNDVINVTCEAFGHPAPEITWSVNGSVLHKRETHQVSSELSVQVTQELLRSGVMCYARNSLGSSEELIRLQEVTVTTHPTANNTERKREESKGVLIVAIIVCILAIAVLGAVLYFLYKKGKIPCGHSGKQDITKPGTQPEDIVVEMKSDKAPEETELLPGPTGEKPLPGDQGEKYIDLRN
ncbi:cell surface glycoprotein MUC18-like isoform X2 [Rhinatrema bivittatum]|uniref:cell surface glycoprotein MUC18-like isoform X2 n=1 Tax=Rhinatrema bivittatum TaxID=194408 RepID=UPI001127AC8A|nr:cell surface glycoprotein MUC18-like isoform X2 [Rhinatrema bivittatum]